MYGVENVLFPDDSKSDKTKATPKRDNAVSRLMRDLREWNKSKHEFACIDACPLESNILEWHCNICPETGNFKDIIFHLILFFTNKYPLEPPEVKLCTTMPHPNVFGDWICLDMIKRYDQGRYKGWTSAYSVTSLLMQLQSFLFEEGNVDQMEGHTVQRSFNKHFFDRYYLPNIKSFKCNGCKHCWNKPNPIPLSVAKKNQAKKAMKKKNYQYNKYKLPKDDPSKFASNGFAFWDGIYKDLETVIFAFFTIADLLKLRRVSKKFECLVHVSKMIQKDSVRCWFHRVSALPTKEIDFTNKNVKDDDMTMLCLGYGVTPKYFENAATTAKLQYQIFASEKKMELASGVRANIGNFCIIQSIDTTFDLLSSDAFNNFGIKKTVFKDCKFTHFLPLYLNKKHGKSAMKKMEKFVMKLWKPQCGTGKYHPWLALNTVANIMKSLIVSVMQTSETDCEISLHYSINVLEAFFRLHHTLLGIYFSHKKEVSKLLQHEMNLFFKDRNYRNKTNVPDYGIFLAYLTLWENKKGLNWNDIALKLLDETFIRQVKWVLTKHQFVAQPFCSRNDRLAATWDTSQVSLRLFMFNYFFFKQCCSLGDTTLSLKEIFNNYNENFGFPKDNLLPVKLQNFVKNIQTNVHNYKDFFQVVEVRFPGFVGMTDWLYNSMINSEIRGYHKPWLYNANKQATSMREIVSEIFFYKSNENTQNINENENKKQKQETQNPKLKSKPKIKEQKPKPKQQKSKPKQNAKKAETKKEAMQLQPSNEKVSDAPTKKRVSRAARARARARANKQVETSNVSNNNTPSANISNNGTSSFGATRNDTNGRNNTSSVSVSNRGNASFGAGRNGVSGTIGRYNTYTQMPQIQQSRAFANMYTQQQQHFAPVRVSQPQQEMQQQQQQQQYNVTQRVNNGPFARHVPVQYMHHPRAPTYPQIQTQTQAQSNGIYVNTSNNMNNMNNMNNNFNRNYNYNGYHPNNHLNHSNNHIHFHTPIPTPTPSPSPIAAPVYVQNVHISHVHTYEHKQSQQIEYLPRVQQVQHIPHIQHIHQRQEIQQVGTEVTRKQIDRPSGLGGRLLVQSGSNLILVKSLPHPLHNGLKPSKPPIAVKRINFNDKEKTIDANEKKYSNNKIKNVKNGIIKKTNVLKNGTNKKVNENEKKKGNGNNVNINGTKRARRHHRGRKKKQTA